MLALVTLLLKNGFQTALQSNFFPMTPFFRKKNLDCARNDKIIQSHLPAEGNRKK